METGRVRFGELRQFLLDRERGDLFRDGVPLRLQHLPLRLLTALSERPGEVLTRTELAQRLWGTGTFVDAEAGLNTAIAKLREALGDTADAPKIIQTVPRRGYRFVAPIWPTEADGAIPRAPERRRWRGRGLRVALTVAGLVLTAGVAWWARPEHGKVAIAVVLFHNETDRPEWNVVAERVTDSVVARLTAVARFAVIGNAPELRTARPFSDLRLVRDRLGVQYIVIGQLQRTGDGVRVMAHLIRASDLVHLWARPIPFAVDAAGSDDREIADQIAAAAQAKIL